MLVVHGRGNSKYNYKTNHRKRRKNRRNFQFKRRSAVIIIKVSGAIINLQNVSSIKNVDASYAMLNDTWVLDQSKENNNISFLKSVNYR